MMHKHTRTALEKSIVLWGQHHAAGGYDPEAGDCALCNRFRKFNTHCERVNAKGEVIELCPVRERSGHTGCRGTPFYEVDLETPKGSKREIDFLKSLRPKDA